MKMIHPGYIVYILFTAAYLTAQTEGFEGANPSVTLTVEGGGSLVGEHCPGTVKIFCYRIHLSVLRWRYNGNIDVMSAFLSDTTAPSSVNLNDPAFIRVELLSVAQDPAFPSFANFSSELVVNVSNLRTGSVTSITCGDPGTSKMIPVDVEIIQKTEPESPNGTNVTALYEDGSLTDIIVSWGKLEMRCPEFQSSLIYQVSLLGSGVVAVNHTSCGEACIVNFQNFSGASEEYRVSLFAVNDIGESKVIEYPTSITTQSSFYFTPTFLSNDCLFIYKCFSTGNLDTDSCNVLYTTNSMYMDPSPIIVSPLNTQFEITGITSDNVYYFEFSVSVNQTLLVRNRLTEQAISSPRLSVLVIVFLTLTILAIVIGAFFGTVICVLKELNGFSAKFLFFGACILGAVSSIFLIVFSIITGAQDDTCSLVWSRGRDTLIIVALISALSGNIIFLVCFLLASRLKKESSNMDQGNMHRKCDYANSPNKHNFWSIQLTNECVTENTIELDKLHDPKTSSQSIITSCETSALGKPKEIEDSIDCIPDTQRDVSSGQKDATAESSAGHPKKINTTSEDNNLEVPSLEEMPKNLESSLTKQREKYTVYKVVVRLKDRSYFLFRRYGEFEELFNKIKKNYLSEAGQLKLGGKIRLVSKFNPDFIIGRRAGLHDFTIKLMKIPNILEFPPVRVFLAIDYRRSGVPIYDYETIDEPAEEEKFGKADRVELSKKENTTAKITDFELLEIIGKGTFGKVYLGRYKGTSDFCTIKVLQKEAIVKCHKVKHIMAKRNDMTHPFLVDLHYSFQTSTNLYFVLDYVNGGALFFHLQREKVFNEPRARFYAAEITSALGYLHSHNIIYWDLKIENILLDANGHIILTDFGLCKEKLKFGDKSDKTTMICGTPEFLAPEVLSKQEYYGYSVDWWCMGIVTYEMMYGLPPFYSEYSPQIDDNILHKPLQLQPHITLNAQNLLKGLLQKDKDIRLGSGIGDDEEIKAHQFFEIINWDDLYHKRLQPPFNPREKDVLDLQQFDSDFTDEAISDKPSLSIHSTVDVPSVSIANNTFNVMN